MTSGSVFSWAGSHYALLSIKKTELSNQSVLDQVLPPKNTYPSNEQVSHIALQIWTEERLLKHYLKKKYKIHFWNVFVYENQTLALR